MRKYKNKKNKKSHKIHKARQSWTNQKLNRIRSFAPVFICGVWV